MTKKLPVYSADFETTTTADDCRVWVWGLEEVGKDGFEYGLDIESFVVRLSRERSIVYFHNLKFDGMFLLDYLLNHGFEHTTERAMYKRQFSTLISDMGKFYSMRVKWPNGATTEFRDSYKKFPMSVSAIAETFGQDELKGDLDYHKPRPVGYQPTEEELDYLRRDLHIVALALIETMEAGMTKLTVGSDSLAEFKRLTGDKTYKAVFPTFNHELDSEIRRAYRGGYTYANPKFSGRRVGSGNVFDVNSLYPYIMHDRLIPHGTPTFVRGRVLPTPERPLTIFAVTFTAKLKPGHLPCIQVKGTSMFAATEYLSEIPEPTELMVTNVDWDLYNDHYDITVLEYGGGWAFMAAYGIYDEYIAKWSKVKETSKGGARAIAKLHLNSLYGKMATNPNVTSKYPVLENGQVKLVRGPDEQRMPVYTAAGVFITSWARDYTIRAAQSMFDVFAYADTDSLHLIQDEIPASLDIHPTRLGAWKHEYAFEEAFYIRAKAYVERRAGGFATYDAERDVFVGHRNYTNAIAGLPVDISEALTFDDIFDGNEIAGKLVPKTVPGGVVLADVPYKLKV